MVRHPILRRWAAGWNRLGKRHPWITRLGIPAITSVAVHAVALVLLLTIAWRFASPTRRGLGPEFVITLEDPAPNDDAIIDAGVPGATPLVAAAEPPQLTGQSDDWAAAVPELRSAAAPATFSPESFRARMSGAAFAGLGAAKATRVVYVVDASGAMITSLQFVVGELERSIGKLEPTQRFQVIFFGDRIEGPTRVFKEGEAPRATTENKRRAREWMASITPAGRSNPDEGLRRAFDFDPDVVFFLSTSIRRSGESTAWSKDAILAELDRLNPADARTGRRRAAVKTIQFLEEDPTGAMQAIGETHGGGPGSYRVITLEEIQGR